MKLNKIILPAIAATLSLSSCEDNKMEWGKPEDYHDISSSEIPLGMAEKIANYKNIKEYIAEYTPHMNIGIGIGADYYMNTDTVKQLSDANFQVFTLGNAMKHDAVVRNNGDLNFKTIDAFRQAVPTDAKFYGHNFIWHTQQNQTYLKSLIAPKMIIQSDSNVANQLTGDNSHFNGGTLGSWGSWGDNMKEANVATGAGKDGSDCMVLTNKGDGEFWAAQCAYTFDTALEKGKAYILKFKAKSTSPAGSLQFQYQNSNTYGSQGGYHEFSIGMDWTDCEVECTITDFDDVNRILLNFGKVSGSYYIDDIEFGLKLEDSMENILTGDNSDFEGGSLGNWGSWGNGSTSQVTDKGNGYQSDYAMTLSNPTDGADYYVAQAGYDLTDPLVVGETYIIQFYAKSDINGGVQFAVQNPTDYSGEGYTEIKIGTEWMKCEYEYTCVSEGMKRILLSFGKYAGNFYIDNVKFGVKKTGTSKGALTRGTTITYEIKSTEEKKALLEGAMEAWIKGMFEHIQGDDRFVGWDVINEPITDGDNRWRGIDGAFGSSDENDNADATPTEDETNGLNLNWANGHFYWGYYLGKNYACKAFELARQYAPQHVKLFVNDYNLETSPNKLKSLIEFVEYIDQNNATGAPIVDGIGTQMHAVSNLTKAEVDAMFQTLAATGKLIRITELDVRIGYEATANPSAEQLQQQADAYRMIIESYKENVPQAQQSGITIWGLSDHADEHTHWFPGDTPNLLDANYTRKPAYKAVCDGIAGRDISEDFTGDDWQNAY